MTCREVTCRQQSPWYFHHSRERGPLEVAVCPHHPLPRCPFTPGQDRLGPGNLPMTAVPREGHATLSHRHPGRLGAAGNQAAGTTSRANQRKERATPIIYSCSPLSRLTGRRDRLVSGSLLPRHRALEGSSRPGCGRRPGDLLGGGGGGLRGADAPTHYPPGVAQLTAAPRRGISQATPPGTTPHGHAPGLATPPTSRPSLLVSACAGPSHPAARAGPHKEPRKRGERRGGQTDGIN